MPLGRRKVPFSGKAKKVQLQKRRERTANLQPVGENSAVNKFQQPEIMKINAQPFESSRSKSTKYALQFFRESNDVIKMKKEEAYRELSPNHEYYEIDAYDYYISDLDFPKRPNWTRAMTSEELNLLENNYFSDYVSRILDRDSPVSFFELNLETWRQLWRVLEKSDIILVVVDIRFPSLMFPPSLYHYVKETLKKSIIMVLNKIDLVPPSVVVAWKTYFEEKFSPLYVLLFTSFPQRNDRNAARPSRRSGHMKMAAEGAQALLNICAEIVDDKVDLSSWQKKIQEDINEWEGERVVQNESVSEENASFTEYKHFHQGILTIGCIGFPNAGKSSLMNALMGKKVVSVSRTPGHTKHFQTIFLTPTVKLCDCPGLVFPSRTPKHLQVLMGSFPIAQLQEPYSSIKFLAEHVDLIRCLSLQHPTGEVEWSAYDICGAWAQKRGYFTARAARPDTYRAANQILRMNLEGKFKFFSSPPEYVAKKDFWEEHQDVQTVMRIRGVQNSGDSPGPESPEEDEESDTTPSDGENESDDLQSSDDSAKLSQQNKFSVLCPTD